MSTARHRKALRRYQQEIERGAPKSAPNAFKFFGVKPVAKGYRFAPDRRLMAPSVSFLPIRATKDAVPKSWLSLTLSGGRYYSDPANVPGAGGGEFAQAWDNEDWDYLVDPERVTDGAGTEVSPWQPTQAFAFNPAGVRTIIEWLPGNVDYTDPRTEDNKFPYWRPAHGGASGQPLIHRARYRAALASTDPDDYTSFRRIGGSGAILGIGVEGDVFTDVYIDGFNIPTWCNADGVSSEAFQLSNWNGERCKFIRNRIDGESAGNITGTNNYGGIWHSNTDDCEAADNVVQNIGSASGLQIWSGFEWYDCHRLEIHHNRVTNVKGNGIYEKGELTQGQLANRIHHNFVSDVAASCLFNYTHDTGTVLADANWWYQNVCLDALNGFRNAALGDGVSGIVVANNVFGRCTRGSYVDNHLFAALYVFRNNIFYSLTDGFHVEDGGAYLDYATNYDVDRNRYDTVTNITQSSGGNRDFAYWQATLGQDPNGANGSASFTNAGSDDFTLQGGSAALNAGTDYLSLLGGSSSAAINQGAFITSDMSDQIGVRE